MVPGRGASRGMDKCAERHHVGDVPKPPEAARKYPGQIKRRSGVKEEGGGEGVRGCCKIVPFFLFFTAIPISLTLHFFFFFSSVYIYTYILYRGRIGIGIRIRVNILEGGGGRLRVLPNSNIGWLVVSVVACMFGFAWFCFADYGVSFLFFLFQNTECSTRKVSRTVGRRNWKMEMEMVHITGTCKTWSRIRKVKFNR